MRSLFVFCLIFGMVGFAAAQTKPVTNADLEMYRQNRMKAEREYRENYAKLGLSSPEELEKRTENSRVVAEQLSAKLRAERLERERIEAEREANATLAAAYYRSVETDLQPQYDGPSYFFSYDSYGRRYRYPRTRWPYQSGYFAGGQFWPAPRPRVITRPAWIGPRPRPRH